MATRRQILMMVGAAASAPLVHVQAQAAPLRLLLPTPAGGPSDTAARVLMQAVARAAGSTVVVENRPGANGGIAAQAALAAAPDGRTLLWGLASMTGIPLLQKAPAFQSLAEFTPVSLVGRFAYGLFAHPGLAARTVAELVALAKAQPEALNVAHGTLADLMAAQQFMHASGTRLALVPYKGAQQLMPDLLAGRVQLNFGPLGSALPQVAAGKLRLLATWSASRPPGAPDVPTLAEAGVRTGALPTWQAVLAPPRTPRDLADRLSREIAAALRDAAVKAQFDQLMLQPEGGTPEALAGVVAQDFEVWRQFVRDNGLQPE